jgi:hypothetical protein
MSICVEIRVFFQFCLLHEMLYNLGRVFLVNKRNKLIKLEKIALIFFQLAWTEFQTQFQVSGPSLKLGPRLFFYVCVYLKITRSWD